VSWKDRLHDASLRGVAFKVDEEEATLGRRVQVHEYPLRDKPFAEDLGRATRRFSVQAYIIGDDYDLQRNRLIEAIEKPGSCTLIHPFYGEMIVTVDDAVRITHSASEGRMCRVIFSFIEAGELSFPTAGIATVTKLENSCSLLDDALSSVFKNFGMDSLADFIQNSVINNASAMFDVITAAFQYVDAGISDAAALLQGDLSVLLSPPSSGSTFITSLQTMWRAGTRLAGDASDLITMIKGLTGVTLESGLAPVGVWSTDSNSTQSQTTQSNYVAEAIRVSALSEAAYAVTSLPQVRQVVTESPVTVSHPAVSDILSDPSQIGATTSTGAGEIPSWDELTDVRTTINNAIDRELERVTDDQLFLVLRHVRTDVNSDISARLEQTAKMTDRTPPEVLPALVLAADWYDDAGRASDITIRNGVSHPGFVPVKSLRVPVQ